jgi:apolipoprotein N-acyltransferase
VLNSNHTLAKIKLTWVFATLWLASCVWWLYIALHQYGGLPAIITVVALFVLCGGLALYFAAALWVYVTYSSELTSLQKNMCFAACWTFAELARAQWWTGFPWAAIGYSQVDTTLSLAAPYVGVYGIGFLSLLLSAYAYEYFKGKKTGAFVLLGLCLSLPMLVINKEVNQTEITVNLLQGNIKQDEKFNIAKQDALEWYLSEIKNNQADIVVLPETAIPFIKEDMPSEFWDQLKLMTQNKAVIIGIPTRDKDKGYGNSAIGLGFKQELQYDKYHLVPFGEFTPDVLRWFTRMMSLDFGDFNRGSINQPAFEWRDQKLAITICYEDLFGEDLAVRFNDIENAPSLFVNISNIGWFGDTSVVTQPIDIARMRSMEFKRPTIRATNSGGTAIISAGGEVLAQLKPYTRGHLTGKLPASSKEITVFAYWAGKWGLMPLWIFTGMIMLVTLLNKRFRHKGESVK